MYYDGQWLPVLCFRIAGNPMVDCVAGDGIIGVRMIQVTAKAHDKATLIMAGAGALADQPYPPERFARHMQIHARNGMAVDPAARPLLDPLLAPSSMPAGPVPFVPPPLSDADAEAAAREHVPLPPAVARGRGAATVPAPARKPGNGAIRTSGSALIRELSEAAGLPPEKARAKLRQAGLRAPYTDSDACRKALGVK